MSRLFDGVDDVLSVASAAATAVPLTMACWFNTSVSGTAQTLMALGVDASGDNRFILLTTATPATDRIRAEARTTTAAQTDTSTAYSTGVWQHACGVFASITDRRVFLNGGGKNTNATSKVPAGINATRIGSTLTGSAFFSGLVAYPTIWAATLAEAEVVALANRVHPLRIRPQSIVFFPPLLGGASPEPDYTAGQRHLTVTGAVIGASNPPVQRQPDQLDMLPLAVAAAGGGGASHSLGLLGVGR